MATVRIEHVTHRYLEDPEPSIIDCSLTLRDGEFLKLYGESASGKSTLLRTIAGLEVADSGRVTVGARDVTRLPPKQRDVAMVFENYALYPHMTAAENIGFPLRVVGISKSEREERVYLAAGLLGLDSVLDRKPQALSGGQRQRVAIARALIQGPSLLLLDEPFTNLPLEQRTETLDGIRRITKKDGISAIYATDNRQEIQIGSDRIAMMRHGHIDQVGTLEELMAAPATEFVATAFGTPQPRAVTADLASDGTILFAGLTFGSRLPGTVSGNSAHIRVVIKPRHIHTSLAPADATHATASILRHEIFDGTRYAWCNVRTDHGLETILATDDADTIGLQRCTFSIDTVNVPAFDATTGMSLL